MSGGRPSWERPERPERPDLSIIIVGWNVREYTLRCIQAVESRSAGISVQLILVDNASVDGTAAAVRDRFPAVEVVEAGANLGFPRANNLALPLVRGRHLLYLNPDTEVGEGTLRSCVAALDDDPSIGVVGCRLLYPDGSVQYEGARSAYRLRHLAYELLYLHMLFPRSRIFGDHLIGHWAHDTDRDVDAVCGAFLMVRSELAREIGGFPEDVFMYFDDLAFCLRVRARGWRVRYLAGVATIHHTNRSSRQRRDAEFALLEPEYKVRLIREGSGRVAGAAARGLFALRSLLRMVATLGSFLLPGGARLRARYPAALHMERHWLQLKWSVMRRSVSHLIPPAHADP
jgi:GT2 family glycosyltransferase